MLGQLGSVAGTEGTALGSGDEALASENRHGGRGVCSSLASMQKVWRRAKLLYNNLCQRLDDSARRVVLVIVVVAVVIAVWDELVVLSRRGVCKKYRRIPISVTDNRTTRVGHKTDSGRCGDGLMMALKSRELDARLQKVSAPRNTGTDPPCTVIDD